MSRLMFTAVVTSATLMTFGNYAMAESIDGVWSTEYGCTWLEERTDNVDTNLEDKNVASLGYLDAAGVNGYNWGCAFNNVNTTSTGVINAESNCWLETDYWKQDIVIKKDPAGWIVTLYEDNREKVYLVFDTKCVASK